ncbi:MAG: c-type cytochrome [Polyangiaceae bacterium]
MDDVAEIMEEVFQHRMGGAETSTGQAAAISHWINAIPAPAPMRASNDAAVLRGKELFESAQVGCADCHSGAHLTNNQNASVGRAETLQVPTLIGVAWRAPFMHDGCAATLRDRFDNPACGGDKHGNLAGLSESDIDDLVAYLESL